MKYVPQGTPESKIEQINMTYGLNRWDTYVFLGEMDDGVHVVVLNISTGNIIPKIWEPMLFVEAEE